MAGRIKPITETKEINGSLHYYRDGIELNKGAVITTERIDSHKELYKQICNKFTAYPDLSI